MFSYFSRYCMPARRKTYFLVSGFLVFTGVVFLSLQLKAGKQSSKSRAHMSPQLGTQFKINVHGEVPKHIGTPKPQQVVMKMNKMSEVRMHKYLNIFDASEENEEERNSIKSNQCVPLSTTLGKTPICIYDPKIDIHISRAIMEFGIWETTGVELMASLLEENPGMQFLDIGCNIGVYTLQAANMGREVIAVDANKFNLRLLSKSLNLGGLRQHATLVWNAMSDIHEKINLTITSGNIGGSFVKPAGDVGPPSRLKTQEALTITLDDLIVFVKGKPVFIKIDIEGSEWKTFRGGESFLQEVDVRYILMEWAAYRTGNTGHEISRLLSKFGFQPYAVKETDINRLNIEDSESWPWDVLWIRE